MVTELLQKYIWLVQTFVRAGKSGLSLGEIEDRWESRFNLPYSRRTFNNHREAVEEVFGIKIECNRSTNCYYIDYSEDVSDENAETACASKLQPIDEKKAALEARRKELYDARQKKKEDEVSQSEKDELFEVEKEITAAKSEKEGILAEYAADDNTVKQLIDITLLQNNMLTGEALNNFVKRSIELMK